MIRQSVDVLRSFTGKMPGGWLGPGRGQTFATLDYVAEAGFKWFGDWVMDDQPFDVATRHGSLLSIPYSVELNDITIMLTGLHESDAMLKRVRDAFDQLHMESAAGARILSFGVHPYITGAAHRISISTRCCLSQGAWRRAFLDRQQIYDWYRSQSHRDAG